MKPVKFYHCTECEHRWKSSADIGGEVCPRCGERGICYAAEQETTAKTHQVANSPTRSN